MSPYATEACLEEARLWLASLSESDRKSDYAKGVSDLLNRIDLARVGKLDRAKPLALPQPAFLPVDLDADARAEAFFAEADRKRSRKPISIKK